MLDFLVPEGLIVKIVNNVGEVTEEYYSDESSFDGDFVVLVNEVTASASELFTQTLRDFGMAKVVGMKTYGKGTVLSSYTLPNGGNVTFSTGLYTTNSGAFLEGDGIVPDYEVDLTYEKYMKRYELPIEEDDQLQKALEVIRSN